MLVFTFLILLLTQLRRGDKLLSATGCQDGPEVISWNYFTQGYEGNSRGDKVREAELPCYSPPFIMFISSSKKVLYTIRFRRYKEHNCFDDSLVEAPTAPIHL